MWFGPAIFLGGAAGWLATGNYGSALVFVALAALFFRPYAKAPQGPVEDDADGEQR